MEYLIVLMRLLHILSGVLWAGAVFTLSFFLLPAINALGASGGKMMQQFVKTNNYPLVMSLAATTNILSGIFLYWHLSYGFMSDWILSNYGVCLTAGGLSAIVAFVIGISVNLPGGKRMQQIAKEIEVSGGTPTGVQIKEMTAIKNRMTLSTNYIAYLLLFTVATMAIARYS
ncbi:MAG: hypothetical protein HYZ54_11100 [Ignavibacteriae bacterium]|nr:hypothetical protein [Ignavibacteriota bacterium]